jgi:hypothetical protein
MYVNDLRKKYLEREQNWKQHYDVKEWHNNISKNYGLLVENWNKFKPRYYELIAKNGNLDGLKKLKEENKLSKEIFDGALEFRTVDTNKWLIIMKWLVDNNCPYAEYEMNQDPFLSGYVAEMGDLNFLKILKDKEFIIDEYTFSLGAKYGNLDLLKWLYEINCPNNVGVFEKTARIGNLTNLKWLKKYNFKYDASVFTAGIIGGNIEVMEWLKENNFPISTEIFRYASEHKQLVSLKWLNKNYGYCGDVLAIINAINNNDREMLEWLLEIGCEYKDNKFVLADAAKIGNLDIIKLLYNKGALVSDWIFASAGRNGNLENMKWMLKNNFPHDAWVFAYACEKGNMENLEWLLKNNFSFDKKAMEYAIQEKNIMVLDWLLEYKFPYDNDMLYQFIDNKSGIIPILDWLKKNKIYPKAQIMNNQIKMNSISKND